LTEKGKRCEREGPRGSERQSERERDKEGERKKNGKLTDAKDENTAIVYDKVVV